jgi:hypothetical protein
LSLAKCHSPGPPLLVAGDLPVLPHTPCRYADKPTEWESVAHPMQINCPVSCGPKKQVRHPELGCLPVRAPLKMAVNGYVWHFVDDIDTSKDYCKYKNRSRDTANPVYPSKRTWSGRCLYRLLRRVAWAGTNTRSVGAGTLRSVRYILRNRELKQRKTSRRALSGQKKVGVVPGFPEGETLV